MEEQYISLETAKLAKEKGFDWDVIKHWKGNKFIYNGKPYNFNNPKEQELWNIELNSAPTQSLLQKWLREVHNIYIYCIPKGFEKYNKKVIRWGNNISIRNNKYSSTYEKALEVGLKEALKQIK